MPNAATQSAPPHPTASPANDIAANDNVDLLASAILRAESRLRDLEELRRIGMDLTRALQRRVLAEDEAGAVSTAINGEIDDSAKSPAPKPPRFDPTEAFAKISRTIRLTINLETRTDDALRALRSGQFLARQTGRMERKLRDEAARDERRAETRDKVEDRIQAVVDTEARSDREYHTLMEAMFERLDNDDVYAELEDRPLRETVERLCHDLGMSPDWSRWSGDNWIAHDGPPRRAPYSIFNTPSRRPLLPDDEQE